MTSALISGDGGFSSQAIRAVFSRADYDHYLKLDSDPATGPVNAGSFRDSVLHLLGGKAARAYRRITLAVSILDEISKFDRSIEKAGPPRGLARGRLEGAP